MNTSQKNIVLFDMDNTLVTTDTIQLWSDFLHQKGFIDTEDKCIREGFHKDYLAGNLDIYACFENEIATIKNLGMEQGKKLREEFFVSKVIPKISRKGLELIKEYKQQPDTLVLLITATISFIARPVADYAEMDDLIATKEEIAAGEFTGKVAGVPSIGQGKVIRFQGWLDQHQISAKYSVLYSDSFNDLPLLNLVDKPIVVDPDEKLRNIALKHQWEIITFKNPDTEYV